MKGKVCLPLISCHNKLCFSRFILSLSLTDAPEGVPQTGPFYVVTGDDITITAYTNIDGNPNPTSIWTKNNSSVTDSGRFDTSVPGQLTITTVILSDTGNYTNTLTNEVLISINNTIELIEYGELQLLCYIILLLYLVHQFLHQCHEV